MRVVFAGTPDFSVSCLEALLAAHSVDLAIDLAAVYTQPDRPAGRGKKLQPSAVKTAALRHGLPVFTPESLQPESVLASLAQLNPDLVVVVGYGLLLPAKWLAMPPLGCVNIHASLLPRWRGAAPIQRAIEAGDDITGVSLMRLERGLDSGAVLARAEIPIDADDTGGSLNAKLARLGGALLVANLPALARGEWKAVAQDKSLVCYASKLEKAEGRLDWRLSAVVLERKVRAFNPWPAAVVELGGVSMKVLAARVDSASRRTSTYKISPGEIISVDKTGIAVATGDGVLVLTQIQKPGGKPMSVAALLNGMPKIGMLKPGMPILGMASPLPLPKTCN